MNFKIRVVENIGVWSNKLFGNPGTVFAVTKGRFRDLELFEWDNDNEPFLEVIEINVYFGAVDQWQTVFELVEESGGYEE